MSEQLTNVIIYHAHCTDGKMAAAIMEKWLRENHSSTPHLIAANYGEGVPLFEFEVGTVYVVDFSYHGKLLALLCNQAKKVIILDHHASAIKKIDLNEIPTNCLVDLDIQHCGALLTWMYCYPNRNAPSVVLDVNDRDLWLWKRPNSKATHLALANYDSIDILSGHLLNTEDRHLEQAEYEKLVACGEPILEFSEEADKKVQKTATPFTVLNEEIMIVNCFPSQISEVATSLIKEGNETVMGYFIQDGNAHLSFRSRKSSGRAIIHAEHFGGGGHSDAAGAKVSFALLADILNGTYQG